jgi:PadR family transcriptional regulator, regulatory protein AphA
MIRNILLGFLNYQSLTGYELDQTIENSTAHFWHAHHSQIYTTLRQMEKEGLLTSVFIKTEGQPDRRVYTITDAGKETLTKWLNQPMTEATPIKEDLLVRIFFSAKRDPNEVLAELRLQRRLHEEKLSTYQVIKNQIPHYPHQGLERDHIFWELTLDMGMRYEEMYLIWLENTIKMIEEK